MNKFDLASHLFAALPLYMAYTTKQMYLFYFTVITTVISLIYHLDENNISLHLDEFASCALIVVTFMTYVNELYNPTYIALGLLLVVVIVDYATELDIINYFVGSVVFVAVLIFMYERRTVTQVPQRLNINDVYFMSFLITQSIAVAFFLWDKDPYAHSLWHLFAFVSLGSAIAHIHENDQDLKRKVFYILGSIPSRLFISAILIDWTSTKNPENVPVAIGTLVLAAVLLAKPIKDIWGGERNFLSLLHGMSYIAIATFIFSDMDNNAVFAGFWLVLDTAVSGYVWYNRAETKKAPPPTYKKIQLQNLRF